MGEHDRGRLIHFHGCAEFFGEAEERIGPSGVQRNSCQRIDRRTAETLPLYAALAAHGKLAVVKREVHRRGKAGSCEYLRQGRGKAETPPGKNDGPPIEKILVDFKSAPEMGLDSIRREQVQGDFGEFAA